MRDLQKQYESFLTELAESDEEVRGKKEELASGDVIEQISVCLKKLGFNVDGPEVENTALPEMGLTFYLAMYQWIIREAKERKMSLRQFTKAVGLNEFGGVASKQKRGFVYYSPRDEVEKFVREKLKEVYPDKKVHHISKIPSLYQAVMRCAYARDMTVAEYLKDIGYIYEQRRGVGRPFGSRSLTDAEIASRLEALFPNKKVKNLATKNRPLYNTILNHAKWQNQTVKQYLTGIGFEYNAKRGRNSNETPIEKELAEAFPDGYVDSFQTHKSLYERIRRIAKSEKKPIRKVLEERGYKYHHPSKDKAERVKEELLELYPDKIISDFTKSTLYQRVMRQAKNKGFSIKEYLKKLGFEYQGPVRVSRSDIVVELKKIYPKKVVEGISNHPSLYENIRRKAASKNMTISQYLRDIGFTYINPKQDVTVNITSILMKRYPNRKVKSLSKHKSLYARIQKQAKARGMSVGEYLKSLGFDYN